MDLKIAAIVLVNDGTLLSSNLKDFGRSPDYTWKTGARARRWPFSASEGCPP